MICFLSWNPQDADEITLDGIDTDIYCADLVRREDRDRYLTSLFAPVSKRPGLQALYAFNLELAKVADAVSEPLLGEIRLQWWREALDGIYAGTPRRNAVVEALAHVIEDTGLERAPFDRMIDARARDLEEAPFATTDDLLGYLRDTSSTLMALAAAVLERGSNTSAAGPGGVAWGLVGVIRSIAFHAAHGRCLLPRDLLVAEDLDPHDLMHGRMSAGLQRVIEALCAKASEQIRAFRAEAADIPKGARSAYLPVTLAVSDLKAVRRAGYDPFRLEGRPRPGRLLSLMIRGFLAKP